MHLEVEFEGEGERWHCIHVVGGNSKHREQPRKKGRVDCQMAKGGRRRGSKVMDKGGMGCEGGERRES